MVEALRANNGHFGMEQAVTPKLAGVSCAQQHGRQVVKGGDDEFPMVEAVSLPVDLLQRPNAA